VSRSGKTKLCNVTVIKNLAGPALRQQVELSYGYARTIITHMFVDYVPDDIVVLLHRMQHNFDDKSLFWVHGS